MNGKILGLTDPEIFFLNLFLNFPDWPLWHWLRA
jgi:hypothetical protein